MALEELAGSEIQSLLSPWSDIDYGSSALLVQNVSILMSPKQFLVIENDWADTPKEAHDYYFLEAKVASEPLGIKVKDNGKGNYTYFGDHTTLWLGAKTKVRSVSVLSDKYEGETEAVEYDAGILVELECGKRLAITRQESISGFLLINHADIEQEIDGLSVRMVL
ncbi:hypothetical protein ACJJIU_09440 [Microbulbifer sp. CnH-101-E]|uniref:hypothetical protein n=1 Tax=unclassified Microbulbifer TaxID=2619833 RepID=UPI0040391677